MNFKATPAGLANQHQTNSKPTAGRAHYRKCSPSCPLCSLISDPKDLAELAELGVLFLLFEMGLELSSSRLAALRVYAFGLGSLQIIVTTAVFVAFAVPFGASLGTIALELLAGADSNLVSISSWDEALVIGVALSLSSSAFVLQVCPFPCFSSL